MATTPPYIAPQIESDLIERLADEYKILQDKIDKIGAFRFTIKGWSITVIIATIFAGSAAKTVPRWLWGISLAVFLLVFFLFEKKQTDLSHRFGQRVLEIEEVLSRLLRNIAHQSGSQAAQKSFITLQSVPGIAHHLGSETTNLPRRSRTQWRACVEADVLFYLLQFIVVVIFVFSSGD